MLALACSGAGARQQKDAGAPIDFVVLDDGPTVDLLFEAVPKNSAHPNLGALFALFLTTKRGQQLHYKYHYVDSHLIKGTVAAGIYKSFTDKGIVPCLTMEADPEQVLRLNSLYKKILRGG